MLSGKHKTKYIIGRRQSIFTSRFNATSKLEDVTISIGTSIHMIIACESGEIIRDNFYVPPDVEAKARSLI